MAESTPAAVLESTFYPYAVPSLRRLRAPLIEIHCRCPREIIRARYRERGVHRHPGHLDHLRTDEELGDDAHHTPLRLGPLIEVDTSSPVGVPAVARHIRAAAYPASTEAVDR